MKYILILLLLLIFPLSGIAEKHCVFTPINGTHGLSGNKVRNITQLPDGRMMITTEGLLNLYDGTNFSYLHYDREAICLFIRLFRISSRIYRCSRIYVA